jgi:hypothetical protein
MEEGSSTDKRDGVGERNEGFHFGAHVGRIASIHGRAIVLGGLLAPPRRLACPPEMLSQPTPLRAYAVRVGVRWSVCASVRWRAVVCAHTRVATGATLAALIVMQIYHPGTNAQLTRPGTCNACLSQKWHTPHATRQTRQHTHTGWSPSAASPTCSTTPAN